MVGLCCAVLTKTLDKNHFKLYIQVATHQFNLCDKDRVLLATLNTCVLPTTTVQSSPNHIFPKSHLSFDLQVNVIHVFITNRYSNKATKSVMLCVCRIFI